MKADTHPEYHMINVKMTDGTVVQMKSTWGKEGDQLAGHRWPRVQVQEQVRRSGLLNQLWHLIQKSAASPREPRFFIAQRYFGRRRYMSEGLPNPRRADVTAPKAMIT